MAVFGLDGHKKSLMPSRKSARRLLERGRTVVHRMVPFTIRQKDCRVQQSAIQPVRLKRDPGSQTTGFALVRDGETVKLATGAVERSASGLTWLAWKHRGPAIREALRQCQGHRWFADSVGAIVEPGFIIARNPEAGLRPPTLSRRSPPGMGATGAALGLRDRMVASTRALRYAADPKSGSHRHGVSARYPVGIDLRSGNIC